MEQSLFIKHFPLTFKICTFLDFGTKQFNKYLLLLRFFTNVFFFFTTITCMYGNEGLQEDSFTKAHDMMLFLIFLSNEIFLVTNKDKVCTLVKLLVEPFDGYELNTRQSKIVEDYNKEVTLYGKLVTTFFVVSGSFWSAAPLLFLLDPAKVGDEGCTHLALGWVWKSESYLYILPVYITSVFVCLMAIAIVFLWYLVMVYMIIKIKFKIRLLCADLDGINSLLDGSEQSLLYDSSNVYQPTVHCEDEDQVQTAPQASTSGRNEARLENLEEEYLSVELVLQKYSSEHVAKTGIKVFLRNIVEQHFNIIKHVKLVDKNFRISILVYVQLGVIIVALAIPKINLGKDLLRPDYIHRSVEVLGMMAFMAVFNYFGQIILNESEALRQALYTCNWMDKPQSMRLGLHIMQIMATKPLKLTVGGIYTLSMETYGNIANAAYSYTSLLQSLSVGAN